MSDVAAPSLKWSAQLNVLPTTSTPPLKGDKIILPPSALERLLAAATVTTSSAARPQTSTFDPYNPYSFAAERQAREQVVEQHQQLPHPLIFRLVNPENGRIIFSGIREFSAADGAVGISPFLRHSLGISDESLSGNDVVTDQASSKESSLIASLPKLTIHVQELPKGTYAKFRPLEAGYDPDDWKALLEQYLRNTFTTLTNGEVITIPAGKDTFRFLVDGLKPNEEAISLVDTDLEVDIEPLNEDQARETLQKLIQKSQRAPGSIDGSSVGGQIQLDENETGQVRPGEYVDYTIQYIDMKADLEIDLSSPNDEREVDLFVSPFNDKHRSRPREDAYVFGNVSNGVSKKLNISHTNAYLDGAESIWISVRGFQNQSDLNSYHDKTISYNLRVSTTPSSSQDEEDASISKSSGLSSDEELCSNCQQVIPKRTMFLHQNFCFRNNVLCQQCKNVFQKSSEEWKSHWHCSHDSAHGNSEFSKAKHDNMMHTTRSCKSCDYEAANVPDLAYHSTTTCPGRLILCQFCHLQVPQQGPEDPSPDSAEVILSGLTPHEVSDGARTTECHLCSRIVRLRDMSTHLKHHDLQRLSRSKPKICRNANCGRTIDRVTKTGEVKPQAVTNELAVCDTCFGPLYVSQYDPDGKALRRRVERKYLTQLLTGCQHSWCRNEYCKTGRKRLEIAVEGQTLTSKDAMIMIKPMLEAIKSGSTPMYFCTDESSQKRRTLAEMIAAEVADGGVSGKGKGKFRDTNDTRPGYDLEWCIAALDAEGGDLDRARAWLKGFAPTKAENARSL